MLRLPSINDRVCKGAIIGVTSPLPRRPRIALRERWLARLERGIARRARLLIIAHPKSGNTWLKVMLTRLYARRAGVATQEFSRYIDLAGRHGDIPVIAATNGWYTYERAVGRLVSGGDNAAGNLSTPVVFLARHPIDVAVSWYFQFTRRQSAHKQELINAELAQPVDRHTVSLWDFVRHEELGLPALIAFLNHWDRQLSGRASTLITSYEALRADPAGVLRNITALMGELFDDAAIEDAVQFGAFENLRELERSGFFRAGGLTLRNGGDPESRKVRRAKIGGYRDYFEAPQLEILEQMVRDQLAPRYAYCRDDRTDGPAR